MAVPSGAARLSATQLMAFARDPAAFSTELDTIRRRGLAYDRQEYHLDIAGISAGISEGDAVVASLTVAIPAQRFARTRLNVRDTLLDVVSGRTPLPG